MEIRLKLDKVINTHGQKRFFVDTKMPTYLRQGFFIKQGDTMYASGHLQYIAELADMLRRANIGFTLIAEESVKKSELWHKANILTLEVAQAFTIEVGPGFTGEFLVYVRRIVHQCTLLHPGEDPRWEMEPTENPCSMTIRRVS